MDACGQFLKPFAPLLDTACICRFAAENCKRFLCFRKGLVENLVARIWYPLFRVEWFEYPQNIIVVLELVFLSPSDNSYQQIEKRSLTYPQTYYKDIANKSPNLCKHGHKESPKTLQTYRQRISQTLQTQHQQITQTLQTHRQGISQILRTQHQRITKNHPNTPNTSPTNLPSIFGKHGQFRTEV